MRHKDLLSARNSISVSIPQLLPELDINFNTVMSVIRKYKETGGHEANKKRKTKKKNYWWRNK